MGKVSMMKRYLMKVEKEEIYVYYIDGEGRMVQPKLQKHQGELGFWLSDVGAGMRDFWQWIDEISGIIDKEDLQCCLLAAEGADDIVQCVQTTAHDLGYGCTRTADPVWLVSELQSILEKVGVCTSVRPGKYDAIRKMFVSGQESFRIFGLTGDLPIKNDVPRKKIPIRPLKAEHSEPCKEQMEAGTVPPAASPVIPLPVRKPKRGIVPKVAAVEQKSQDVCDGADLRLYIKERTEGHCRTIEFDHHGDD